MMVLRLNDLGRSFLAVDKFVSQPQMYADTRPTEEVDVNGENSNAKNQS